MRAARARGRRGTPSLVALVVACCVIAGCDGGSKPGPQQTSSASPGVPASPSPSPPPAEPTTGTGTLTFSVVDIEGRPLVNASVGVYNRTQTATVGRGATGTNGLVTIGSVPAAARVHISHAFADHFTNIISVPQDTDSVLTLALQAGRPRPTVALLPVSITPGSLSADRTELKLEVAVVASAAAPFALAGYGNDSLSPSLALDLEQVQQWGWRDCFVWLDRTRTVPTCGPPKPNSPYTVSIAEFNYDPVGTRPLFTADEPARSAMVVLDQSARVAELDPQGRRSFAARRFIERETAASISLSLAGFAGAGGNPPTPPSLPNSPLYLPMGTSPVFSTDQASLMAATRILEPLTGGSAPVFDALQAALTATATHAPPGNRAVIALLGGGDTGRLSEQDRRVALTALRQQRDDAGIPVIVISAGSATQLYEHVAIAELAAALRAPAISLGVRADFGQTWEGSSFAALDLAADLVEGRSVPTLSAVFDVKADEPFVAGTLLPGVIYVETTICPMGCAEIPLYFAVEIP